jgi:hypothetical protein
MNCRTRAVIAITMCMAMSAGTAAFGQTAAPAASDVPNTLAAYAQKVLVRVAQAPSITQYIEAQNARRVRVEDLKALDARWAAAPGVEGYMWDLMRNRLAWDLVNFQYQHKFITEAFAMDARGAIVAETNRTSTFYKGEAKKFTEAYAGGVGVVWFGPSAYDDSTAEMEIQVSVPVMKGGKAIGVICFGVSLDRWEERRVEE